MPPRRVPGEYIVQIKAMPPDQVEAFFRERLSGLGLKSIRLISAQSRFYKLTFEPDPGPDSVKRALSSSESVISVEPNLIYEKF
ncbi:MAG: hypothetical protein CMN76_21270 [Spirochaetaceae bacterium]|nr:hypothetical protein [Spirochaetaceae bacterium]